MNSNKITKFDISIISDPHVLSKDLIEDNENFNKELKIERKLILESKALFERSLEMVDKAGSNYLMIPGDLTKEGEYKSHELVSSTLEKWKNKDTKRKIFMIPGNHDINNHRSYDFKNDDRARNITPKEFMKLYDFIYSDPSIIELYKDSAIFHNYLARVNAEYEREDEYRYYAHGYGSYAARIKESTDTTNGLTLIMLDTSIYSIDTEQSHREARENVPGSLTIEQLRWTLDIISDAKKRKDLIFVMAHHALVPNFRNQELVFSPFIIKEWRTKLIDDDPRIDNKTPIEVLADNGVKFVFTGHLHENGTAKFISEMGNEIYDVQTGSTITYPLPIRHIKIENKSITDSGFEIFIKTELIKDFTFHDLNKNEIKVDDALLYTMENQLSLKEVMDNYIKIQANNPQWRKVDLQTEIIKFASQNFDTEIPYHGYMNDFVFPLIRDKFPIKRKYIGKIDVCNFDYEYEFRIKLAKNTLHIKASNIEDAVNIILDQLEDKVLIPYYVIKYREKVINKIRSMPIDEDGHTFYDFANYVYQYISQQKEEVPQYVTTMIDNLNNPNYNITNILIEYAHDEINEVFDRVTSSIKFEKDGSKDKFYDDLIQTEGITSNLAYKYLRFRINNMRDLLNFFSRFITKKSSITGVDLAKRIVHLRSVRNMRTDFTDKMFGEKSLRKILIKMVGTMSDEMKAIYQNEDENELEHYFNYIEYDESESL